MAISDLHHFVKQTDVGAIDVCVQDGRTFYVRAGLDERGVLPDTREPLDAGRGVKVDLRAHFKLIGNKTVCPQPFIHRVDQGRDKDPTRAMTNRVVNAISGALEAYAASPEGQAELREAQNDVNEKIADERTALSVELHRIADHLVTEALALRTGGRWTYRERRHSSGFSEKVQRVELPDGTLLPICRTPPTIYGSTDHPDETYVREEREEI
jgi:hypothetical protein